MRTVGFIMLGVGVLLFVVSLVLMVVFKVPELIDELSGRKAKRQIKRLKELNEGTGVIEGMETEDFYMSVGSIPTDITDISDSIVSESKRLDTTTSRDLGDDTDNQLETTKEEYEVTDDGEEAPTEMVDDTVDEEETPTDVIDDLDKDEQPTDILTEDESENTESHVITILEEQSSID